MLTETYKGRKLKVKKGREWGTIDATCNGTPVSAASAGGDQAKALAQLRADIDWIDERPVDGSRWGAEWYAPGTYTLCENDHPVALGGQCVHPYCIKQRGEHEHRPVVADNVTAGERNHRDGYVYCAQCLQPLDGPPS